MKKIVLNSVWCVVFAISMFQQTAYALTLTSLTLDAQNALGQTLNAPGGIYSTNLADPLSQAGVMGANGTFLNQPGNGLDLGEIAIDLQPGLNTFKIFGNFVLSGEGYPYYGLALFFDGLIAPQIAVYNQNGGTGNFLVNPTDSTIVGSANGGSFFDQAPGAALYQASDGSTVSVINFTVGPLASGGDLISWGNIGADGYADLVAEVTLNYAPVPEPTTLLLMGAGLLGVAGLRRRIV